MRRAGRGGTRIEAVLNRGTRSGDEVLLVSGSKYLTLPSGREHQEATVAAVEMISAGRAKGVVISL